LASAFFAAAGFPGCLAAALRGAAFFAAGLEAMDRFVLYLLDLSIHHASRSEASKLSLPLDRGDASWRCKPLRLT
jgi:hypothetical protein